MKARILLIFFFFCITVLNSFSQVKLGEKVPGFELTDQDGNNWILKKNLDQDYLVIYFYPAAFTSGCTSQACSYRDKNKELNELGAAVVGISGDEPGSLKLFAAEHRLNFTLLSDESGDIARLFNVPVSLGGTIERELNGKLLNLSRNVTIKRWTFILDKRGRLIYKDAEADPEYDSMKVIDFLSSLE